MAIGFRRTAAALTAGMCLLGAVNIPSVMPTAQVYAADFTENGTADGYYYELWNQDYAGEFNYENTENNGFTFSWDGIVNALVLKGDSFKRNTLFASRIKEYDLTYDADVNYMDGSAFAGVYGWMEKPNAYMEFYIIDSWGSWRPNLDKEPLGSFESNGITYDIYKDIRSQMACFSAEPPTYMYYSIAHENLAEKTDGVCNVKNTVNIVDHFKAWSEAGFELGYMYDAGFSVQPYRSKGEAKLNSLSISKEITDNTNYGPVEVYTSHEPNEPDEEGRVEYIDFEAENSKVRAVGENASAVYDSEHSFSGEKAMHVSGGSFEYKIDPYDFKKDEYGCRDIAVGMKLYHNGDKDIKFNAQLITSRDDKENIVGICSRTGVQNRWSSFENISFALNNDIFSGQFLRITASEPVDFWIDDFYIVNAEDYPKVPKRIRGDMNGDKKIDIYDVIALRKELLRAGEFNICSDFDVNGDCKLDISDLVLLTGFVLGRTDSIPEPEREIFLDYGGFNKTLNGENFEVNARNDRSDNVKTAVRSDGSFMADWHGTDYYEVKRYKWLEDFDELSIRYSGIAKTVSHKDDRYKKGVELKITGHFKKNYNEILYIFVNEGYSEDAIDFIEYYNASLDIIDIGGKKYYMERKEEELGSEAITRVWLYCTESFNESDELSNTQNEVDFAEIMKALDVEGYKPKEGYFEFSARNADGYVDFDEISFNDKSKKSE